MEEKNLLTVQEVAARLRVNEATVRRWILNGSLAAITLPRRGRRKIYRVYESTLAAILNPTGAAPAPGAAGNGDPAMLKLHLQEEAGR